MHHRIALASVVRAKCKRPEVCRMKRLALITLLALSSVVDVTDACCSDCTSYRTCCTTVQRRCCDEYATCRRECCKDSTTSTTTTTTTSTTTDDDRPTRKPPTHRPPTAKESHVRNDIALSNAIHNVNKFDASVAVNNHNRLSVVLTGSSVSLTRPPYANITAWPPTTRPATTGRPQIVYRPIYYPIHVPVPQSAGCCVTLRPAIPRAVRGYECGAHCVGRYVYKAIDPCYGRACHRRERWSRHECRTYDDCHYVDQDCGACGADYYASYESYRLCSGCFYY